MRVFVAAVLVGALCSGVSQAQVASADEKKEAELKKLLEDIETAMKANKYTEVVSLTKKAAELDPKNPAIFYAAGTAHLALRQNAEAVKAFTELIKLEPK